MNTVYIDLNIKIILRTNNKNYINKTILLSYKRNHMHSSKDLIFRNKYNIIPREIHLKLTNFILQCYLFY